MPTEYVLLVGKPDALRYWLSDIRQGLELVRSHMRTDRQTERREVRANSFAALFSIYANRRI
jgi:hypothetical protein